MFGSNKTGSSQLRAADVKQWVRKARAGALSWARSLEFSGIVKPGCRQCPACVTSVQIRQKSGGAGKLWLPSDFFESSNLPAAVAGLSAGRFVQENRLRSRCRCPLAPPTWPCHARGLALDDGRSGGLLDVPGSWKDSVIQ
eukprot:s2749_g5.t1